MTAPTYMTVREAADLAHVSHKTVRRWFLEGRLTRYRVGPRRVLVDRAEIENMIRPVPSPDHGGDVS